MAPPPAQPKDERAPTMAPPCLQRRAIKSVPTNQTLKFTTSTWIGIIFHQIRDIAEMKEDTSFLWVKAHPQITVRTLKYMYYARHPLEDFALKHIDYYPDEDDQVKDLCNRSPFPGSNVVVLRVVEEAFAEEIDGFDAWEARKAKKLGKDCSFYHARHIETLQLDDDDMAEDMSDHDHIRDAEGNNQTVTLESTVSRDQDVLRGPRCTPELLPTKFSQFAEQKGYNQNGSHHSKESERQQQGLGMRQDQQDIGVDVKSTSEHAALNVDVKGLCDTQSQQQWQRQPGNMLDPGVPAEAPMIEELQVSVSPEPQPSQTIPEKETIVQPFTPSVWKLLQDRLESLPGDARQALMVSPYMVCGNPICRKTLVLQPWTQFDHFYKPMCSECSDAFMQVELAEGLISENTWMTYKRLMSHQLAMKQQRASWGQRVNLSDDAPLGHADPLPDLAGRENISQPPAPADLFVKSVGQGHTQYAETSSGTQSPAFSNSASYSFPRNDSEKVAPQYGPPPRSSMVAPNMALTTPMDTASDSFFENAKTSSDFLGAATWTPRNVPQRLDDTIDPSQLCRTSNFEPPPAINQAPQQSPFSPSAQPPKNVHARRAFTNFARPDVVKNQTMPIIAPPPAPRQSTKRRAANIEEEIQAELAELGGHDTGHLGPRERRMRHPTNLRNSKNATQSDDDFVVDEDEEDEDDIYSTNHRSAHPKPKARTSHIVSLKPRNAPAGRSNRKPTKSNSRTSRYGFDDPDEEYAAIHETIHVQGSASDDDDDEWTPEY